MNNLYHHIVTEHKTALWKSPNAKVSIRKQNGEFVVRTHDYFYKKKSVKAYKTLEGAQIAAECVKRFYL
jgi:hypothetical protein